MPESRPRDILVIAASDPCGGAGIEADIKVVSAHGLNARSAITALTVQDSRGMRELTPTPEIYFRKILAVHADDMPIHAVKIGAMAEPSQPAAIADLLRGLPGIPAVLDPVMAATSGASFVSDAACIDPLLPLVALVTPNIREASLLSGIEVNDFDSMERAARTLLEKGAGAVLIKGGHLVGESRDLLVASHEVVSFENRLDGREYHGTGCALASAIACRLAQEHDLRSAVDGARSYLKLCMERAVKGRGRAWLLGFPPSSR